VHYQEERVFFIADISDIVIEQPPGKQPKDMICSYSDAVCHRVAGILGKKYCSTLGGNSRDPTQ
jgi:hypothetical protein